MRVVYSEVTPLIPRSSAMMTAAFSPIAIAVLYMLAPTLLGVILQSKQKDQTCNKLSQKNGKLVTGDFQVLYTIYIQPCINNPTLFAWLHRTSSDLENMDG